MTSESKTWASVKSKYLREAERALSSVRHPRIKEVLSDVSAHLDRRFAELEPHEQNWESFQNIITEMGPPADYAELLDPGSDRTGRRAGGKYAAAVVVGAVVLVGAVLLAVFAGDNQPAGPNSQTAFPDTLNEDQRVYMDWTQKTFGSTLDRSEYADLSDSAKAELEDKWIKVLEGPWTRKYYDAINSLAAIRSRKAVKVLLQIATERREKDNRDRWMATRALGIIADESVVAHLIPLVYHYNQNTRFWAQISLVRLTGVNFGRDWQAWGRWWNEQKREPAFDDEVIVWTTRPDWAEYADPQKQKEIDRQFVEKHRATAAADQRRQKLQQMFYERTQKDQQTFTDAELGEIERLYQVANKQWGSDEAKESLRKLVSKYTGANRVGCALLYLGQMSEGQQREDYLKKAIEQYDDCWYGDGVQIGAYARWHLAFYYRQTGRIEEADKLFNELGEKYPDAVDHKGGLLSASIAAQRPESPKSGPGAVAEPIGDLTGTVVLKYDDGTAEGKRSLGASGHAVTFERERGFSYVEAVQIFASRYGHPQPPSDDFYLYLLNEKQQIIIELKYPYSMVERGDLCWYTLQTPSIEVPERFMVALAFNPHRTKGIYLGYDESIGQTHSFTGLPDSGFDAMDGKYNWMVRVHLAEKASGARGVQRLADWKPPKVTDPFAGCSAVPHEVQVSEHKQSYGGRGPAIEFDLGEFDLLTPAASFSYENIMLKGFRLYASRYGSGYDPDTTFVAAAVLDSQDKVRWQGKFPYALFSYKPKWVDLVLTEPVAVADLIEQDRLLRIAFNPQAHRTKGIYFHYNKGKSELSKSFAGTVAKGFEPVTDRQWIIRAYFASKPEATEREQSSLGSRRQDRPPEARGKTIKRTGVWPPGDCDLTGQVFRRAQSNRIGHAKVQLTSADFGTWLVEAEDHGYFSFRRIPPGTYSLKSTDTFGYKDAYYNPDNQLAEPPTFELEPGQSRGNTRIEIKPLRPYRRISGKVLDEKGEPITDTSDLQVYAWVQRSQGHWKGYYRRLSSSTVNRDDGSFLLDDLDGRAVYVQVVDRAAPSKDEPYPPRFHPGTFSRKDAKLIEVGAENIIENVDIRMAKHGGMVLQGVVTDGNMGQPVGEALVSIFHYDMFFDLFATYTDEQGRYRLEGLGDGKFIVHVDAVDKGFVKTRKIVSIETGIRETKLDSALTPGVEISGKFVDQQDNDWQVGRSFGSAYVEVQGRRRGGAASNFPYGNKYAPEHIRNGCTVFSEEGQGDHRSVMMVSPTESSFLLPAMLPAKTFLRFSPHGGRVLKILYQGKDISKTGLDTGPGRKIDDITIVIGNV
ncbi:MAG: HEAT repeat domain-containing protein [Planctomycetota bacterium]|jgi:protocatechuate 3,4-dioxygenase beta subunit/tetratricopeptide (TPR) repeat protein